jgi:hypothetical protein
LRKLRVASLKVKRLAILPDADNDLGVAESSTPSAQGRRVKVNHREERRSGADRNVNFNTCHQR